MINIKKMSKKVVGAVLAATATMAMTVSAFAATPATIEVTFNDNAGIERSTTVSTQPLIDTGTYFQGDVLNAILRASGIDPDTFTMKYGTAATMLDVIHTAATTVRARPVYGATDAIDPETEEPINGIYIDSLFDKGTVNHYIDKDGDGEADRWEGSYWNIRYTDGTGAPYSAAYYANNESLENTPVTDIDFTYVTTGFDY